jgi:alpha-tubulin suppressor-like RCC1 family protein
VFVFGFGGLGQLGLGAPQSAPLPTIVPALTGKRVVGVTTGCHHTVVWTAAGEAYSFGCALCGRLGLGALGLLGMVDAPRVIEAWAGTQNPNPNPNPNPTPTNSKQYKNKISKHIKTHPRASA